MISVAVQKLFWLVPIWFVYLFVCLFLFLLPWETDLRKHLYGLCQRNVLLMFSPKSFMVSCFMCKCLSHFEFIFVHGVRVCSSSIDLHAAVQLSYHHLLKILFPILYSCLLWQRISDHRYLGLLLDSLFCSIDQYVSFCTDTTLFDYCSFTVLSEVRKSYSSCFFFLQDCFGNSGSFGSIQIFGIFVLVLWKIQLWVLSSFWIGNCR